MNIQIVREKIREFLAVRVKIYRWDLDFPDKYYFEQSPANTAIELPAQNIFHKRDGYNSIRTSARFPYRITYIFPQETHPEYHDLPIKDLEGMLSNIHLYSLLQTPDPNIIEFGPADLEDSLTIYRSEDENQDWLASLNFAFDAVFNTTEFNNTSVLQPPDYYDFDNPPTLEQITIRVNRAKEDFSRSDNTTYVEDSEIVIAI